MGGTSKTPGRVKAQGWGGEGSDRPGGSTAAAAQQLRDSTVGAWGS